jgi:hypothetical protein
MEIHIKRSGVLILIVVLTGAMVLWISSVKAGPDLSFTFMGGVNDPSGSDHNCLQREEWETGDPILRK